MYGPVLSESVAQAFLHWNICWRQLVQPQVELLNALSSLTSYQNSGQSCHFLQDALLL